MSNLFETCPTCEGRGFIPATPLNKFAVEQASKGGLQCGTCDGWRIRPTAEGKPFFDMVQAMRSVPAKHWPGE